LNAHWGPYHIFIITLDAPYSQEDRTLVQSWLKYSNVTFIAVDMYSNSALETEFNINQFKRWNLNLDGRIDGGNRRGSTCRLWSGHLQNLEFLNSFQYYMRLDDSSFFTGDLKTDPFGDMKHQGLQYAYYRQSSGSQTYNNFHVASVRMFRHPLWKRYMRDVQCERRFFNYRLGDANIHAIATGMLLQPKEVAVWGDLPYVHDVNDMNGYPPQNWKSECMNTSFVHQ
jgi:hypothetical protein